LAGSPFVAPTFHAVEPLEVDVAGVGAGPSNLSLAALLAPVEDVRAVFLERKPAVEWHAGTLFPSAAIQVPYLKDLVTPVDPTSPYSFVAFLVAGKRFYRFVSAGFPSVSRVEFSQYLRWVATRLPTVRLGSPVSEVCHQGDAFLVHAGDRAVRARNLVLGTGRAPYVPRCAAGHLGAHVFHVSELLLRRPRFGRRRVAVIGGGQSGAEVVDELLSGEGDALPDRLHWISKRRSFLPLDDSPFANEWFTPAYSDHFFTLPGESRRSLLLEQRLASDGHARGLLARIYRRLYALEFLQGRPGTCELRPDARLVGMERTDDGYRLCLRDLSRDRVSTVAADVVVLATGYRYELPGFLRPLAGRIHRTADAYVVRRDYSIEWDGPPANRIYVQNGAGPARGIADPNISLMAWRSATIINSLARRTVYDIDGESATQRYEPVEVGEESR
jgi:lysine N6-hydroxylase